MSFEAALIVMAAGMGSRFGGLKQMEAVGRNGEAILDFSVYDAVEAGFSTVVFVIKHEFELEFKELVGRRVEEKVKVKYVFQDTAMLPEGYKCPPDRTKPWGTAHAIYCCRDVVDCPFAVINADDYYGKTAFKQIYNQLKADSSQYCMVGFRLVNTLTENGSVSRGVCEVENGKLAQVVERTKIIDCKYEDGDSWVELPPDTVVSMNMWGFSPDIFGYIENFFCEFLDKNIDNLKSEYYLPYVVSRLIEDGTKSVEVLVAEDKWYGITYREDMKDIVAAIGRLIDDGCYRGI